MSWQQFLSPQLWTLRLLFLPVRRLHWLLWLALALAAVGGLLNWLWQSPGLLFFSCTLGVILIVFSWIFLPLNLLGLASNKSLSLAFNLRGHLLGAMLLVVLCFSLVIGLLLSLKPEQSFWFCTLVTFAALSLYLQLVVFVGSYGLRMLLVFPLIPFGVIFWTHSFVLHYPVLAGLICLASWGLFIRWWLSGNTQVSRVYAFIGQLNNRPLKDAPLQVQFFSWRWLQGPGRTLTGSLLLGSSDGLRPQLYGWFFILAAYALAFGFLAGGARAMPIAVLNSLTGKSLPLFMGFILFTVSLVSIQSVFVNAKRLWLYFPGNRLELLAYVERRYLRNMLLIAGLGLAAYGLIAAAQLNTRASAVADLKLLGILWLVFALHFFLALLAYVKAWISFQTYSFINIFLAICILLLANRLSASIAQAGIWLPALVALAVVYARRQLWREWPRVNLIRSA